jgi:hypothetical protein
MEVLLEIAIACKDRILLLDRDLLDKNLDVSKGSKWSQTFYSWKGRHYQNLKQGPGWSFPRNSFPSFLSKEEKQSVVPPAPVATPTTTTHTHTHSSKGEERKKERVVYDVDIPDEVRRYFEHYETIIFPEDSSTR